MCIRDRGKAGMAFVPQGRHELLQLPHTLLHGKYRRIDFDKLIPNCALAVEIGGLLQIADGGIPGKGKAPAVRFQLRCV